jgi:Flp pilus assembly protein TadG
MRNRKAKQECALAFDESGAFGVIGAIIFTAICGFVGLALDFGHYYKVRAELQRTADAGALAGVTGLFPTLALRLKRQTGRLERLRPSIWSLMNIIKPII